MNCEELNELAGAYALYALSADEMEAVQAHLAGCSKHAEIADFVAVAALIAIEAPEMDPPPALKTRFMDAVRADAPPNVVPSTSPGLLDRVIDWTRGRGTAGWAVASGLAVLVAALFLWNMSLQSDSSSDLTVTTLAGTEGVSGRVVFVEDENVAVMSVEGLAPLPPESTYQVWAIAGDTPVSIGFMAPSAEGRSVSAMDVDLSDAQHVAVTIEPAGGSLLPTTDPVLAGDI